ncbi:MAG: hypothetical protein GW939_02200, partial [Candidatus Magasanikbacteria bacterium]|nr:hypothetical protein [Candidatus Magasanikbacteria bacterium]
KNIIGGAKIIGSAISDYVSREAELQSKMTFGQRAKRTLITQPAKIIGKTIGFLGGALSEPGKTLQEFALTYGKAALGKDLGKASLEAQAEVRGTQGQQDLEKKLFGFVPKSYPDYQEAIKGYLDTQPDATPNEKKYLPFAIVGAMFASDLTPFGGSRKLGSKAVKELIEATTPDLARVTMVRYGLPEALAERAAKNVSLAKTAEEVEIAIKGEAANFMKQAGVDTKALQAPTTPRTAPETAIVPKVENITQDLFTKQEIEYFNRNSFFSPDWNKDYNTTISNIKDNLNLQTIPPELNNLWDSFLEKYTSLYKKGLEIRADNPSPMVTGRANFNFKRRDKLFSRERNVSELKDILVSNFGKKVKQFNREKEIVRKSTLSESDVLREKIAKNEQIIKGLNPERDLFFVNQLKKNNISLNKKITKLDSGVSNEILKPNKEGKIERYAKEMRAEWDGISLPKSEGKTPALGKDLKPDLPSDPRNIVPPLSPKDVSFEPNISRLPVIIKGETFTLGTSKTTQPTIKELKAELKATKKEIKNAQIAKEKAEKLTTKEQKTREEAMEKIERFRGNTDHAIASLKARNLSDEDIANIVLEDGTKLIDTVKVKRNTDGSLSTVITKKEIDDEHVCELLLVVQQQDHD